MDLLCFFCVVLGASICGKQQKATLGRRFQLYVVFVVLPCYCCCCSPLLVVAVVAAAAVAAVAVAIALTAVLAAGLPRRSCQADPWQIHTSWFATNLQ